jgi:hypothetical protein
MQMSVITTEDPTDVGRMSLTERATFGMLRVEQAIEGQVEKSRGTSMRWVWVVLIGILVIAAAAAWIWCMRKGYRGFNGRIEALKGPLGIKIGVKIGCY